jgi:hypothetical protein
MTVVTTRNETTQVIARPDATLPCGNPILRQALGLLVGVVMAVCLSFGLLSAFGAASEDLQPVRSRLLRDAPAAERAVRAGRRIELPPLTITALDPHRRS